MNWTLELVPIPVADIDRAKRFYSEQAGFKVEVDTPVGEMRIVQLTPPGSACSIVLGAGTGNPPGSVQGLHLCVRDIEAARAELADRGVDIGNVTHVQDGAWVDGRSGEDYNSFAFFSDPDGNGWVLQEISTRG